MNRRLMVAGVLVALLGLAGGAWWFGARQIGGGQAGITRAVVLNRAGNLELVGDDGSRRQLTETASSFVQHLQVTPAPDGQQVAYIEATLTAAQLKVQSLDGQPSRSVFHDPNLRPFYIAWSPDSRWISFLASDSEMHLFVVPADGSAEAREIRAGQPSYFAWTPDSQRLLLHIGGASPRGSILQQTIPDGKLETLDELAGDFQSPGWDAAGAARFVVVTDGTLNRLVRIAGKVATDLTEPTADALLFSLSPDRSQIAYMLLGPDTSSPVFVIDAQGGAPVQVSRGFVKAFFWSPDGSRIATIVQENRGSGPSGQAGIVLITQATTTLALHWDVITLADRSVRAFPAFKPSLDFLNLLPYFDQYATSLSIWSPASDRLIYGTEQGVVSLRMSDGSTTTLSDGGQGFWVPK